MASESRDATNFDRVLLLAPDLFPPLAATVRVEYAARSQPAAGADQNGDHFLALRLGRSQETLLTNLPHEALTERYDEYAYAMVVADGTGAAGELASRLTVAALLQLALRFGRWQLRVDELVTPDIIQRLTHFYRQIDSALVHVNRSRPLEPLHTTLTAIVSGGRDLFLAHVGHSRAYLYRSNDLIQLTRDHTHALRRGNPRVLVDLTDAAHDLHHILTDAMGAGTVDPHIDVERLVLVNDDVILLCTNGLTDVVDDRTIATILASTASAPMSERCDALIARAIEAGAADDATVMLMRYHVPPE